MIKASRQRQKGKDVTSDDIRKRREKREAGHGKPKTISQSSSSVEGGRAQSETGYTADRETTMKPNKMADGKKVGKVDTPKAKQAKSLKEMMDERKKRYNSRTTSYGGY